jgi:hypothetical protein
MALKHTQKGMARIMENLQGRIIWDGLAIGALLHQRCCLRLLLRITRIVNVDQNICVNGVHEVPLL